MSARSAFLLAALLIAAFVGPSRAQAGPEDKPLHWSADKNYWDRRTNKVELFGHAKVAQPGEVISGDYILLDMNQRTLDARGNCIYLSPESIMYGDEMHFNLDTRTGSIVAGRVSNDKFSLTGERINKLGEGRFQTHWGEYSTCRDCPQSWSLLAEDVDLTFDGYAYLSNVTTKIKEAPAIWLPYLIIPVKSRRQTGLLFPKIATGGSNGFSFVMPFFWAINRESDMTVGLGDYTARGFRTELEGRYALTQRSQGKIDFYSLHDKQFTDPKKELPNNPSGDPFRWGLNGAMTQELPFHIDAKLKLTETSDNLYPSEIADIPGAYDPVITTDLSFSYASDDVAMFMAAHRVRNLLDTAVDFRDFDNSTVQVFPRAQLTTNDKFLFGSPIATGLTLEFSNFARSDGPFDRDNGADRPGNPFCVDADARGVPCAGIDPVRKATRFSVTPSAYTTLRPFDVLSVVPSVKYESYFYNFGQALPNLSRSYLQTQVELSTQFERIFDTDDPDHPRVKHLIRPTLTFSYIPDALIHQDKNHPFIEQINHAGAKGGYQFDDNDIIPLDNSASTTSYYVPQGESLAYGFTTQVIERSGRVDAENPSYLTAVDLSAGQAFNFREFSTDRTDLNSVGGYMTPQPLSRFYGNLNLNLRNGLSSGTTFFYYPYLVGLHNEPVPKSVVTTSLSYVLERGLHQQILTFDRSVSIGYTFDKTSLVLPPDQQVPTQNLTATLNYSINDYIYPTITTSYDLIRGQWIGMTSTLQFQSPSRCWRFGLTLGFDRNQYRPPPDGNSGFSFSPDIALNITGTGFGGVTDVANTAMTH